MKSIRESRLPRPTELAHQWISKRLSPGERAIDATVGNGHDTAALADWVGPEGKVHGFDIQPEAIGVTRRRLEAAGLADRVTLHQAGHESMRDRIGPDWAGTVGAVMFNLGYLPGGDKSRITRTKTTLEALEAALAFLAPGGLLTVIAYPGHPGGEAETAAVETWAAALDQARFLVASFGYLNQPGNPPRLLAVERR